MVNLNTIKKKHFVTKNFIAKKQLNFKKSFLHSLMIID